MNKFPTFWEINCSGGEPRALFSFTGTLMWWKTANKWINQQQQQTPQHRQKAESCEKWVRTHNESSATTRPCASKPEVAKKYQRHSATVICQYMKWGIRKKNRVAYIFSLRTNKSGAPQRARRSLLTHSTHFDIFILRILNLRPHSLSFAHTARGDVTI